MLNYKMLWNIAFIGVMTGSALGMDTKNHQSLEKVLSPQQLLVKPIRFTVDLGEPTLIPKDKVASVVLIDNNGAIPCKTLEKMPLSHSKMLSKYHPNAFGNCTMDNYNTLRNVVQILHAAPESWRQGLFGELGLKNKSAQEKFKSLPMKQALESYSMAKRSHDGLLHKYSVEQLFNGFNRNDLFLLDGLGQYFAQGNTTIQVQGPTYTRMANLPEEIREEFHDKKQFFAVQLMPSANDQIIHVAGNAFSGLVLGSGFGAIVGLGTKVAGETVVGPAVKEVAKKTVKSAANTIAIVVGSGVAHRSGINNVHKVTSEILNNENNTINRISEILTEAPKAYVEGFTNNALINKNLIKKECNMEKLGSEMVQQALYGGTSLSATGFNEACKKAQELGLKFGSIGAFLGFLKGLYTMNDPILTKNISQL